MTGTIADRVKAYLDSPVTAPTSRALVSDLAAANARRGPVTDAQAEACERERESHKYILLDVPGPAQALCSCGWAGMYAREWRLHRERAALEAARAVE